MPKLFESFPEDLKKLAAAAKKSKNSNKIKKLNISKTYAFPKVRKLPLETRRNVLSAINHFDNVTKISEQDKQLAYEKIIKAAESFGICTMGFIDKYKDKYYLEHNKIKEV